MVACVLIVARAFFLFVLSASEVLLDIKKCLWSPSRKFFDLDKKFQSKTIFQYLLSLDPYARTGVFYFHHKTIAMSSQVQTCVV